MKEVGSRKSVFRIKLCGLNGTVNCELWPIVVKWFQIREGTGSKAVYVGAGKTENSNQSGDAAVAISLRMHKQDCQIKGDD